MTRQTFLKSLFAVPAAVGVAVAVEKKPIPQLWYDGTTGEFQWVLTVDPRSKVITGMRIDAGNRLSECTFVADSVRITS